MNKYYETPCFNLIGFDYGESHRAKLHTNKDVENRFPLIEAKINRECCKKIIRVHGLLLPSKSGCYICPYQPPNQWRTLRARHPDLFCKADKLERKCNLSRRLKGKKNIYINNKCPVTVTVEEKQTQLFKRDEYPPCECML